jgi:hypothetical protein
MAPHGNQRHGKTHSPEYAVWRQMRQRCKNPNRNNHYLYGARGIRVCDRWETFENFLEDMGQKPLARHSIDRINPDGHYEPGNCRWATASEQARNKRTTRLLTHEGRTQTMVEWATELGITKSTLHWRLSRRPIERALRNERRQALASLLQVANAQWA